MSDCTAITSEASEIPIRYLLLFIILLVTAVKYAVRTILSGFSQYRPDSVFNTFRNQ